MEDMAIVVHRIHRRAASCRRRSSGGRPSPPGAPSWPRPDGHRIKMMQVSHAYSDGLTAQLGEFEREDRDQGRDRPHVLPRPEPAGRSRTGQRLRSLRRHPDDLHPLRPLDPRRAGRSRSTRSSPRTRTSTCPTSSRGRWPPSAAATRSTRCPGWPTARWSATAPTSSTRPATPSRPRPSRPSRRWPPRSTPGRRPAFVTQDNLHWIWPNWLISYGGNFFANPPERLHTSLRHAGRRPDGRDVHHPARRSTRAPGGAKLNTHDLPRDHASGKGRLLPRRVRQCPADHRHRRRPSSPTAWPSATPRAVPRATSPSSPSTAT